MSRNHIPYFSLYPSDFMNGVRGMSAQEVGVYMMLLCRIYEENGPVEYHVLRLSTYCGMRETTFEKVFCKLVDLGKISVAGGMISNSRAELEISKRSHDLKNNSKAGKVSAEKRQQNQQKVSTPVQQPFNHTDTDTDTDIPVSNDTGEQAVSVDPSKQVFDAGVTVLGGCGLSQAKARQMVGKWRKDHPGQDGAILTAIMDCGRAGAVDPVPWIEARLRPKPSTSIADIFARAFPETQQ